MRHVLLSAIAAASLALTACADGEPTAGYTTTTPVEYPRPVTTCELKPGAVSYHGRVDRARLTTGRSESTNTR